ncbi:MAG: hypothetical protein HY609_02240, partial [Deltaproteobacteria bacterium]|nr:hypothetical protein [Deltaproteobacteria bacterium]
TKDPTFLKRQGANFLSLINDLKRNRKAAAQDLQVSLETIEKIIAGESDIPPGLIQRATEVWPVNRRDFMIMEDDCPEGVLVMRGEASEKSSRIFTRGGADYYEYRDTAMSKVAPFRPEWILELCTVEDNDPKNSSLRWNNGHFMHQFTMFVGPVNFYYIEENQKKVMVANTGDSMYITPFVPHTFATRQRQKGLILALTYGNKLLGDVQQEMSSLGGDIPGQFLLETRSRDAYFASLLQLQMAALSLSAEDLIVQTGLPADRVHRWIKGEAFPTPEEYGRLADRLNVNVYDLMPPDAFDPGVIVSYLSHSKPRRYFNCQIRELASIRYLPYSKALLLDVLEKAETFPFKVPLHQYCYNFGDVSVTLRWDWKGQTREVEVGPNDSVYVKPFVPHSFSPCAAKPASLLSLRIGGKGTGEPQRELSHIGKKNIQRIYQEYSLWYKEE